MILGRHLLSLALFAPAARAATAPAQETVVTADTGDIQSTDTETTSDFKGHVLVTGTNLRLTCDRLISVTNRVSDKTATIGTPTQLKSMLAIGHVHLVQNEGQREAVCGQAEVFPLKDEIVLTQKPVVIDRAKGSRAAGTRFELFRGQRQVHGDNVQFTFPAIKDLGFDKKEAPAPPPPAEATKQP